MGTTTFEQSKILQDMGEYDHEGMCYALSLYWIHLHATGWGGQGDEKRGARIEKLKSIVNDALLLQSNYELLSEQFKQANKLDWTNKKNIATLKLALVEHYCKKIGKIELSKPAKTIISVAGSESGVSDLIDFVCDSGTYHLLSINYANGKGHANATFYGGSWFYADTYLFEPNGFEGDEFNNSSLKSFFNDRVRDSNPKITSMAAIKIRPASG